MSVLPPALSFAPLDDAREALEAAQAAVAAERAVAVAAGSCEEEKEAEVLAAARALQRAVDELFVGCVAQEAEQLTTAVDRIAFALADRFAAGAGRAAVQELAGVLEQVQRLPALFRERARVVGGSALRPVEDAREAELARLVAQLHAVVVAALDAAAEQLRALLARERRPADAGRRRPSAPVEAEEAARAAAAFVRAQRPWRARLRRPLRLAEAAALLADGFMRRTGATYVDEERLGVAAERLVGGLLVGDGAEAGHEDEDEDEVDLAGVSFTEARSHWPAPAPAPGLEALFVRRAKLRAESSWNPVELAAASLLPRGAGEHGHGVEVEHFKQEWAQLFARLQQGGGGDAALACDALQSALDAVELDPALAAALAATVAGAYVHWAARQTTQHEVAARTPELLRRLAALPAAIAAVADALAAVVAAAAGAGAASLELAAARRLERGLRFLAETEVEILAERCEQTVLSIGESTMDAAELASLAAGGERPAFLRATLDSVLNSVRDHAGAAAPRVVPRVFAACTDALATALLRCRPTALTVQSARALADHCAALRGWEPALAGPEHMRRLDLALAVLCMTTHAPSTDDEREAQAALPDYEEWAAMRPVLGRGRSVLPA